MDITGHDLIRLLPLTVSAHLIEVAKGYCQQVLDACALADLEPDPATAAGFWRAVLASGPVEPLELEVLTELVEVAGDEDADPAEVEALLEAMAQLDDLRATRGVGDC